MGNKGYISVFLTLILSVMLALITALITLIDLSGAKSRSAEAMRSSMSSVRADYNRYLFDQYHVLFLNKNPNGEGVGKLEALAEERLSDNLGESYEVKDVAVTGVTGVTDQNCLEFKNQIKKAVPYLAADYGLDKIMNEVQEGNPVSEQTFQNLNMSRDKGVKKQKGDKDPRRTVRAYQKIGVAYVVLPGDTCFSSYVVDKSKLPSAGMSGLQLLSMDGKFDDISRLERDLTQNSGLGQNLLQESEGLVYAANCFNCLTDQVQDDTVLSLELEYLIAGCSTDAENYKKVANQILLIRTGCNFAYILTDQSKMGRLAGLASAICVVFPPLEPVVKYLLAAAWSYVEAIADLYRLVRGKKVPYMKSARTWITDLGNLSNLAGAVGNNEEEDDTSGLDYKSYLLVLLAPRMKTAYYRMLDVMELNVNRNITSDEEYFHLDDAITAFGMSAEIEYKGQTIQLQEEIGY